MSSINDVIEAWDEADPAAIHPTRVVSEEAYQISGEVQAELLAKVLPAGCRVIDFGCGDGRVAIPLRQAGYDVTGADGSQAMLDRLAERDPGMPWVLSDGLDLAAVISKKTDAVVSLAVLIHHSYEAGEAIVEGLRAAVRVNGLLVLDWPVSEEPAEGSSWISVTTWSREQQDAICKRVGLKRLDSELPWGVFRAVKAGG
ncbi:class I SAM-dependent methyltransferase [Streptomyces flavochromogenes]|jgi:SAM-dependent methyltransferase|uniref:class I SAM-dependent methyltransferase n=1 Tax=Streptomyces flavochromogenes TaxID=68199 RepID=UPI0004C05992|nr:class I SAM-dependent methyltransferase [Streptomyces flavochromogenes]